MSNVTYQAYVQALGAASALTGSELIALIQSGNPVQLALNNLGIALNSNSPPANGIYVPAANTIGFANNSIQTGTLTASGMTMPAYAVTGTAVPANGIYRPSANTLGFATNTTQWGTLSPTGNWVLNSPSSGVALSVTGAVGSVVANFIGPATNPAVVTLTDGQTGNKVWQIYSGGTTAGWFGIARAGVGFDMYLDTNGQPYFPNAGTTASAANAFINNSSSPVNQLLRSTSSRRYKKNIRTLRLKQAIDVISRLRLVSYRSKAKADDPNRTHYGLVAEDVAKVDPSLVNFDAKGRPDGVQYDRALAMLLPIVQFLISDLEPSAC